MKRFLVAGFALVVLPVTALAIYLKVVGNAADANLPEQLLAMEKKIDPAKCSPQDCAACSNERCALHTSCKLAGFRWKTSRSSYVRHFCVARD